MAKQNLFQDKSFDFALRIIEVYKNLTKKKKSISCQSGYGDPEPLLEPT